MSPSKELTISHYNSSKGETSCIKTLAALKSSVLIWVVFGSAQKSSRDWFIFCWICFAFHIHATTQKEIHKSVRAEHPKFSLYTVDFNIGCILSCTKFLLPNFLTFLRLDKLSYDAMHILFWRKKKTPSWLNFNHHNGVCSSAAHLASPAG